MQRKASTYSLLNLHIKMHILQSLQKLSDWRLMKIDMLDRPNLEQLEEEWSKQLFLS